MRASKDCFHGLTPIRTAASRGAATMRAGMVCVLRVAAVQWLGLVSASAPAAGVPAADGAEPKTWVLMIAGRAVEGPEARLQRLAIESELRAALPGYLEVTPEYLPLPDDWGGERDDQLTKAVISRHLEVRYDLVVLVDTAAVRYWTSYLGRYFGRVPVVYSGLHLDFEIPSGFAQRITGVREVMNVRPTVDLITEIQPELKELLVVSSKTGYGERMTAIAREGLKDFGQRIRIRWTDTPDAEELLDQVRATPPPPSGAVLMLAVSSASEHGRVMQAEEFLTRPERLSHSIYTVYESFVGMGAVGGRVISGTAMGKQAAAMALRILHGETVASVPPVAAKWVPMLDWRELRRLNLSERAAASDAIILSRPETFFSRYQDELKSWGLVGVVLIAAGQSLAIWGLVVQRRRRRALEEGSREDAIRLQLSLDAARMGSWEAEIGPDPQLRYSRQAAEICGLDPDAPPVPISRRLALIHPDDRASAVAAVAAVVAGSAHAAAEYRIQTPRGERWMSTQCAALPDANGRARRVVGVVQDITERKLAEERLRVSEERYRLAAQAVSETIYDWNILTDTVRKSGFDERLPESTFTESHPVADFIAALHPEDMPVVKTSLDAALSTGATRWTAEYRHRLRDGSFGVFIDRATIVRDASGKPVRMVGAMSEVTQQRAAEASLRSSEARLRAIVDSEPECVKVLDADGVVLDINASGLRVVEAASGEGVIGRSVLGFISPEYQDEYREGLRRCLAGEQVRHEFETIGIHGARRWMEQHAVALRNNQGVADRILCVARDNTERREAERQLRESEERLRLMAENLGDVFWIAEADGWTFRYVSPAFEPLWGHKRSECQGYALETLLSWVHPEDRERLRLKCGRRAADPVGTILDNDFRVVRPDGSTRWVNCRSRPILGEDGKVRMFVGVQRDITDMREAEQALRTSEERFRQFAEAVDASFWIRSVETGEYMYFSPGTQRLMGLDPARLPRDVVEYRKLVHPDDLGKLVQEYETWIHSGAKGPIEVEHRVVLPDGRVRWWRNRAFAMPEPDGVLRRVGGIAEDVTERHEAAAALEASEARFRQLVHAIDQKFWIADAATLEYEYQSPATAGLLGVLPDQVPRTIRGWREFIHEADAGELARRFCEWTGAGYPGELDTEYRLVRPDGEERWMRTKRSAIRGPDGRVTRLAGVTEDITVRKRTEEALAASERKFRQLTEAIDGTFWLTEPGRDGKVLYVSPAAINLFGRTAESMSGDSGVWRETIHPDDLQHVEAVLDEWHASGCIGKFENRYRTVLPTGEVRWVLDRGFAIRDKSGVIVGLAGVADDITDRERTVRALVNSEERFRRFAETIDSMFWTAEPVEDGRVTYVSPGVREILGVEGEEIVQSDGGWRGLLHPDDIERVLRASGEWARGGFTVDYSNEYRIIRPDGGVRWVRNRGYAVRDSRGMVISLVGAMEDVTARTKAALELRRTLETQRLLLQELDHRVKNNLAGMLGMIDLCEANASHVEEFSRAVRRRIAGMVDVHTLLSETRWSPVELGELIRLLCPIDRTGAVSRAGPALSIAPRQAGPLGMMLQELFSNSTKHGALSVQAGSVAISWETSVGAAGAETLTLFWVEAGGPAIVARPAPGLGTTLVNGFARFELRGEATLTYPPSGAEHRITVRLDPKGASSPEWESLQEAKLFGALERIDSIEPPPGIH